MNYITQDRYMVASRDRLTFELCITWHDYK